MTDYVALRIDSTPCDTDTTDLLAAFLADEGFESFCPDDRGLTAYIQADRFNQDSISNVLLDFPMERDFSFTCETVKGENWNEEWEKHYFKPIVIGGDCVVHSTFHKDVPKARYDIVIDPKMAFGTGHHATTSLMIGYLLDLELSGLTVTDMGTGTGILAILAMMRGAARATGIEIDYGAWENSLENLTLNNIDATMLNGDASILASLAPADLFMANINRNVITADMPSYAAAMQPGATMLLSGFYTEDIPVVEASAAGHGLKLVETRSLDNWAAIRLEKAF